MSLSLFVGKKPVEITKTVFPAGESCIRINDDQYFYEPIVGQITLRFESNHDLFDLALLVDAVQRYYPQKVELSLNMDYLPYARQDRVCNKGESLSIKVVADFINSLNFARVYCKDIHSAVGCVLINNLVHVDLVYAAQRLPYLLKPSETILVSPDAGAEKKVFDFAKQRGYNQVVRATKERDVATGKIKLTTLIDKTNADGDFLIVDDICDGGRTFIELAKVLKNEYPSKKVRLYVTHAILSAGIGVFEGLIDEIFTANLMNDSLKDNSFIYKL